MCWLKDHGWFAVGPITDPFWSCGVCPGRETRCWPLTAEICCRPSIFSTMQFFISASPCSLLSPHVTASFLPSSQIQLCPAQRPPQLPGKAAARLWGPPALTGLSTADFFPESPLALSCSCFPWMLATRGPEAVESGNRSSRCRSWMLWKPVAMR